MSWRSGGDLLLISQTSFLGPRPACLYSVFGFLDSLDLFLILKEKNWLKKKYRKYR